MAASKQGVDPPRRPPFLDCLECNAELVSGWALAGIPHRNPTKTIAEIW